MHHTYQALSLQQHNASQANTVVIVEFTNLFCQYSMKWFTFLLSG
jgi:hypothetical protein